MWFSGPRRQQCADSQHAGALGSGVHSAPASLGLCVDGASAGVPVACWRALASLGPGPRAVSTADCEELLLNAWPNNKH